MTGDMFKTYDKGAVFSYCRRYRYRLWRTWDESKPKACFVLMNCSQADETENDPTVERCQRRAVMLGYGGLIVVNVFAWIETDSTALTDHVANGVDLIGEGNDAAILRAASECAIVICGWGVPGELYGRGRHVLQMLREAGHTPHALKINADGSPVHPLYQPYSAQPVPMA